MLGLIEVPGLAQEIDELEALYARPAFSESVVELISSTSYEVDVGRRFAAWLGEISVRGAVEVSEPKNEGTEINLLTNLLRAKQGSPEALSMIKINVATAVAEACFKKDHISKVSTHQNESGELMQFGQTMTSVHKNALTMRPGRHSILQEVTKVEALNGQRIEAALEAGDLNDYYFVVPSIVPENVPEEQLGFSGDGYFLSGLTFVVQATTKQLSGEITTEAAFIEGVENGGNKSFEERMASRHDIKSLAKIYESFGLKSPQRATDFLNNGLKIPKNMMPNGVADFMRWCDQAKDEVLGQEKTRRPEDYIKIIDESRRREASLASTRQMVMAELLACVDELDEPMQTVKLMWNIIKKHTVETSFRNTYIDPVVFGAEAAGHIQHARYLIQNGQENKAYEIMEKALETAVAGGCGGGSGEDGSNNSLDKNTSHGKETKLKCVTCPLCNRPGVDATIKYEGDKKTITCSKCNGSKTYKNKT